MKNQEKTRIDQSLETINEQIHWNNDRQRHSRNRFLSKLDKKKTHKRKSWVKRKLVPVIASVLLFGTAGTLIVSEYSEMQQAGEPNESLNQHENASGNISSQAFEIGMNEETESDIMEIRESGFNLQLPQYSPIENTELINVFLRSSGEIPVVQAGYYNEEGDKIFTFLQEDISESNGINHIKENADYETELNGYVTYVNENENSGSRTINIIAGEYGFTLWTYELSEEQLLSVAESIN